MEGFNVKPHDLIISCAGTIGKVAIVPYEALPGVINQALMRIRPNPEIILCRYLKWLLESPKYQRDIFGKSAGSALKNLAAISEIKKCKIPLPPLEEQRRIAAILDKADGVRRKRKEAIRLTEELLRSTFLEMFGDSERNFREHCGQDCFLPLEKCIERFIDYRGKTPTKANSGVPLITAKIIKNGRIQPPNEFIARENYDSWMRRGLPQLGDVLFTTEAPLGEVAQVDDPDIALAQRVLLMRGKSNILDNTYLFGTLQSSFVRDQIERRSTGSTVKGIRQKELRKVVIPIPPIFLQRKYASFAVSQQKCTDRQKLLFKESENLFNSLLQKAFRGEL
jgi:type I restriction enzyme S subunit